MPRDVFEALEAFRVAAKSTLGDEGMQALAKYDALMRLEMGDFAKRREAEQQLAAYIQENVLPVAGRHEQDKLRDIAQALAACRTSGEHGITIDYKGDIAGRQVAWTSKCGLSKLCPDESRVEGRRIAERYLPATQAWVKAAPPGVQRRVFYAVLTEPNYPVGGLHDGKRQSFARFVQMLERIRHTKANRIRVGDIQGALVVQEDPLSALGTWNGHLNVIFLVEGQFSYEELRKDWGYNLEIKHIPEYKLAGAFLEVCKYQAKAVSMGEKKDGSTQPGMVEWAPELWLEWWRANTGFRRTRSYGVLFNIPEPEEPIVLGRRVWLGRVQWGGSGYRVEHYDSALAYVDLIQGDKSGILVPKSPKKRRRKWGKKPPGGGQGPVGLLEIVSNSTGGPTI